MHIAGHPDTLTPQQRELVALAAALGREKFAPRAAEIDRDARFPFDNYADLRDVVDNLLKRGLKEEQLHGVLVGNYARIVKAAMSGATKT